MAKKKNNFNWFWFFILIIIICGLTWATINYVLPSFKDTSSTPINQTEINYYNITNNQTYEAGTRNMWDFLTTIFGIIIIGGFTLFFIMMYYKYNSPAKLRHYSYNKMIKETVKKLREKGYEVGHEVPKFEYKFYGVDDNQNPATAFIFYDDKLSPTDDIQCVNKDNLISCVVDEKTFRVMNEKTGRNVEDLKKELNEQRKGKNGVPNFAGSSEHEEHDSVLDNLPEGAVIQMPLGGLEDE